MSKDRSKDATNGEELGVTFETHARVAKLAASHQAAERGPRPAPKPKERPKPTSPQYGKRKDPNYTQLGVMVPKELRRRLKHYAVDHGLDVSVIAEEALTEYLAART